MKLNHWVDPNPKLTSFIYQYSHMEKILFHSVFNLIGQAEAIFITRQTNGCTAMESVKIFTKPVTINGETGAYTAY